jgi:hypothetical protein
MYPRAQRKGVIMLTWKLIRVTRKSDGFEITAVKGSRTSEVFVTHREPNETLDEWHARLETLLVSYSRDEIER